MQLRARLCVREMQDRDGTPVKYDMAHIEKNCTTEPNTGCWLWTRGVAKDSGRGILGRSRKFAHKVAYELTVGPIPGGMYLKHRCEQPTCCNPAHIYTASRVELIKQTWATGKMKRAPKTHCYRGHPKRNGDCLECARIRRNIEAGRPADWYSTAGFIGPEAIKSRVFVDPNGCWRWKGKPKGGGYGHGEFRGTTAARASFLIAGGILLKGERVWHKCGVTVCCNPEHMGVATQSQIVKQMWKAGKFK